MTKRDITLLYVDDEELNHFIFEKTFEEKYDIITAQSGANGLDLLKQYADKIVVVISDMRMPEMSGVEFVAQARKKYDNIAYFILSGFEYDQEIEMALDQRIVSGFFTKPMDAAKIDRAILDAVGD